MPLLLLLLLLPMRDVSPTTLTTTKTTSVASCAGILSDFSFCADWNELPMDWNFELDPSMLMFAECSVDVDAL